MSDTSRIHLHLLQLPLKTSLSTDFVQSAQASCTAQAGSYLQSLGSAKKALLACLDVVSADGDLMAEEAATSYIALLLGFVNHYTQGAENPTLDPDTGLGTQPYKACCLPSYHDFGSFTKVADSVLDLHLQNSDWLHCEIQDQQKEALQQYSWCQATLQPDRL